MNIRAMYFSGTGTTKKVTAAIADELVMALAAEDSPNGENLGETAGSGNTLEKSLVKNAGSKTSQTEVLRANSKIDPLVEKKSGELPKRNQENENTLAGNLAECSKNGISQAETAQATAAAPGRPLAAGVKAAGTRSDQLQKAAKDQLAEINISQGEATVDLKHGSEHQATDEILVRCAAGKVSAGEKPQATGNYQERLISVKHAVDEQTGFEPWQRASDIDFTPPAARREGYRFTKDDLVIFGVPVIAGRVPNVLLKFLDTLQGGNALAVPVVLYGNRNFDDALIELRNILQDHGFHAIAAAAFIGEHSFSRILGAGRPDSSDMELSRDFARKLAGKIRRHGAAVLRKAAPVPVDGQDPIRPYYKPQDRNGNHINILKVKPKLHAELCSGCGICTTVCPMGSIVQEKTGQVPAPITGICIKCCGCVKKCPNEAFYFDDPGFFYHKEELEDMYAAIRREPALFL